MERACYVRGLSLGEEARCEGLALSCRGVERAAYALGKHNIGADGRIGYEGMQGKPCFHELVELGWPSPIPVSREKTRRQRGGALARRILSGRVRAGGRGKHRVLSRSPPGCNHPSCCQGLSSVRGLPCNQDLGAEVQRGDLWVPFLADKGQNESKENENELDWKQLYDARTS